MGVRTYRTAVELVFQVDDDQAEVLDIADYEPAEHLKTELLAMGGEIGTCVTIQSVDRIDPIEIT